jgi:hypothetical protein
MRSADYRFIVAVACLLIGGALTGCTPKQEEKTTPPAATAPGQTGATGAAGNPAVAPPPPAEPGLRAPQ